MRGNVAHSAASTFRRRAVLREAIATPRFSARSLLRPRASATHQLEATNDSSRSGFDSSSATTRSWSEIRRRDSCVDRPSSKQQPLRRRINDAASIRGRADFASKSRRVADEMQRNGNWNDLRCAEVVVSHAAERCNANSRRKYGNNRTASAQTSERHGEFAASRTQPVLTISATTTHSATSHST